MRRSDQLCSQGKFGEAEIHLLSALKAAEAFAPPDIRLAETLHHLGTVYRELGRLTESEKWYQRSLTAWNATSGESNPGLPKPLISLASLYLENGLHTKAERLVEPWLRDPMRKSDTADPVSVRFLHNFAAIQHVQRKYSQAEILYRQALAAAEKMFGPNNQEIALLLNNLGLLLADAGRRQEAGPNLERAVAIWEGALGSNHPDLARALTNLAAFYCAAGELGKSEPLFQRALSIAESSMGPENRLMAKILTEYAVLLRQSKRKGEASRLQRRAQAIRQNYARDDLGRHTVDIRDLQTFREDRRSEIRLRVPPPHYEAVCMPTVKGSPISQHHVPSGCRTPQ